MVLGTPTIGRPAALWADRHPEGVLATNDDKGVDPGPPHRLEHPALAVVGGVGIGATRPEDRAAPGQDAPDGFHIEAHGVPVEEPSPAVAKADEIVSVHLNALADDSSDHCVQAWAVTPTREHPYSHTASVPGSNR